MDARDESAIDPEIEFAAGPIRDADKLDDAIFAAFRHVEGVIQERVGTKSIGLQLLSEGFDGPTPKILIGRDPADQKAVRDLFAGAIGNIRNDRGHKKVPFLPCRTRGLCQAHLSFASLLLHLLRRDRNTFPRIKGARVFGSPDQPRVELTGENFHGDLRVVANGIVVPISRRGTAELEVTLPVGFTGTVTVIDGENESDPVFCDSRIVEPAPVASYEVLFADVQLYSDESCTMPLLPVVGLLMKVTEGHKVFERITPVAPGHLKAGQFISHGPFDNAQVGETWFRDPRTGQIKLAWTGSLITKPRVLGEVRDERLGGILALPTRIHVAPGERRALRVIASYDRGVARVERDVTERATWKASDSAVAHVDRGRLFAKRYGRTAVACSLDGRTASVEVFVEQPRPGDRGTYFQGLRGLQDISFDKEGNLFACNQSGSIYRIGVDGSFDEVVRIGSREEHSPGIDCLRVAPNGDLLANDMERDCFLRFRKTPTGYEAPTSFGSAFDGPKKGIAVAANGSLIGCIMGRQPGTGFLLLVSTEGEEQVVPARETPTDVAWTPSGQLAIPARDGTVHLYHADGTFVRAIKHGIADSPCGIAVNAAGDLFVAFFHTGSVLRLRESFAGIEVSRVAEGLAYPGGMAFDKNGRLLVSEFGSNRIEIFTLSER